MSLELSNAKLMASAFSKSVLNDLSKRGKSKKFDLIVNSLKDLDVNGKTYAEIYDYFYEKMIKNYRNEYIYKNAIANKIVLGRHKYKKVSYFTEQFIWGAIADVVVANGTTTAYEIKTEYDSFIRLDNQVNIYSKVFDHVNIVIPESKINALLKVVPENIGIIVLSDKFTLQNFRNSESNMDNLSKEMMITLLHAQDKKNILFEYFGVELDYNILETYRKEKAYLLSLSKFVLHNEILKSMHKRQYDEQRKDLVLKSPESLRSILISANYSKPMMSSVFNTLQQVHY
ncbi:sce7726 family protein [Acinetobacter vivianii]|uniref:sce7726 family protein n=1 Tax=Acinetobacter vivianii TaxID=1776742 RepID=UPI004041719D